MGGPGSKGSHDGKGSYKKGSYDGKDSYDGKGSAYYAGGKGGSSSGNMHQKDIGGKHRKGDPRQQDRSMGKKGEIPRQQFVKGTKPSSANSGTVASSSDPDTHHNVARGKGTASSANSTGAAASSSVSDGNAMFFQRAKTKGVPEKGFPVDEAARQGGPAEKRRRIAESLSHGIGAGGAPSSSGPPMATQQPSPDEAVKSLARTVILPSKFVRYKHHDPRTGEARAVTVERRNSDGTFEVAPRAGAGGYSCWATGTDGNEPWIQEGLDGDGTGDLMCTKSENIRHTNDSILKSIDWNKTCFPKDKDSFDVAEVQHIPLSNDGSYGLGIIMLISSSMGGPCYSAGRQLVGKGPGVKIMYATSYVVDRSLEHGGGSTGGGEGGGRTG